MKKKSAHRKEPKNKANPVTSEQQCENKWVFNLDLQRPGSVMVIMSCIHQGIQAFIYRGREQGAIVIVASSIVNFPQGFYVNLFKWNCVQKRILSHNEVNASKYISDTQTINTEATWLLNRANI